MNSVKLYSVARQKSTPLGITRNYSVSSKRAPALVTVRQQRGQTLGLCPTTLTPAESKVPKFTMARTEFMTADLFARHRQLVETAHHGTTVDVLRRPRASFKTLGELALCRGMEEGEAGIPHEKLRQIYAAPASVFMRVTPDAMIPEAMRLGPLAEPLLGEDPFSDGISSLRLDAEDTAEFVDEFFDTILNRSAAGARCERRMSRWMVHEMVDPVDGINGESYQLTSVKRKRASKMNKHKHKKLRKRTRALRKRLGK
ncbi:hypothetical protein H4S07_001435 [Coemansia furcata]|uniref:Uncharacterized protein n=1 Tax=Coemansia furcata TaxID=417177 RepID=A0ACC1LNU9_9FUNG|nr:hypothetical protein H4S07_001435 [Coemansia furcata]